ASVRSKAVGNECWDGGGNGVSRPVEARMLAAARYAIGTLRARLRRLSVQRDPVLLQGRERRWRWPWAMAGLLLSALLLGGLGVAVAAFEALAEREKWVIGGFPQNVF